MRLSAQQLNRTLLLRQHLLERARLTPEVVADHLVGLQGQEPTAPYLSLLARIDGFWLAHAARDRVTGPGTRGSWMGGTGAVTHTVFVDGGLTGVWRPVDGRVTLSELFRDLTSDERSELDEEIGRVETMMSS